MRLVLFDVDGTLLRSEFAHRKVYHSMFREVYGINARIEEIYSSGKTTQKIVEEVLEKHSIPRKIAKQKIRKAISHMAEGIKRRKMVVLPGVKKVLDILSENKNIKLGVISGSAKKITETVLKKKGLLHYFKIRSFGDNIENRKQIIENAKQKARLNDVMVIGDSIYDVKVARQCRAKIIAVATGPETTYSQLKKLKPDFVFNDMSNHRKVVKAILS
jgi:phosphoglycolate phosphatase-like HAD superfamily hydrolase